MKKLFPLIFLIAVSTAFGQSKKYVAFTAHIQNYNNDVIYIQDKDVIIKSMQLNAQGFFKDTLSVDEGMYQLYDGSEWTSLYLKNGYELELNMDSKKIDESIIYSGIGAKENNYLAHTAMRQERANYFPLHDLNQTDFKAAVEKKRKTDLEKLLAVSSDNNFIALQKKQIEDSVLFMEQYYSDVQILKGLNNKMSPEFDYINSEGGKTKNADLIGKYIYIDVWATWCDPCLREIPALQELGKKYGTKNISFVSIAVDETKDKGKWKRMVAKMGLAGPHLMADKDWNSDFIKNFKIDAIPRFILIDPTGKILNADALRPSDPQLLTQLDLLLK